MARGWESKSVEAQIESAEARPKARAATATPEQISRAQERQSLELSRTRVRHDLETATHPRYKATLEAALAFLDDKIKALDETPARRS